MTDVQQSDTEPTEPAEVTESTDEPDEPAEVTGSARPRRRPPAWLFAVAGALLVVAVVAFLRGGGDAARPRDLSTPQGAAEAFAAAASAGDVDGMLAVTCLGDAGCAAEHGKGITKEEIRAAQKVIAGNMRELGGRFRYAEFTDVRAGAEPGTRDVDYRLPGVSDEQRNYLVFVKYRDRWLYIASGGSTTTSPPTASPTPAN
ncbi:hypothetical protein [Actinophytocola sp.]|uniref:hypothetical protein n=1 Tax=Actinophytocola sp. TaxID=1872138 RepID=UPI00389A354E